MRIEAWHFARADMRLGYGDGREIVVGETLSVDYTPKCCLRGLHGSVKAIDALQYAQGPMLCRVVLSGNMDQQDDKIAAEHRKTLNAFDATALLLAFARWCALQVIHDWQAPQVVIDFLRTGDESLRAAARAAAATPGGAVRAAWAAAAAGAAGAATAAGSAAWAAGEAWAAAGNRQAAQLLIIIREAYAGQTEWIWELPEVTE